MVTSHRKMVSVILPTYNNARYLREAISSVYQQDFQDYEIIVVDDGSTDETKEIIDSLGGHIRYVYQTNQGLAVARNTGILHTKGEYFTFLDGDDLWYPKNLEVKVKILDDDTSLGAVFSNFDMFNHQGIIRKRGMEALYPIFHYRKKALDGIFDRIDFLRLNDEEKFTVYKGNIFRSLLFGNFINACSILVRKRFQGEIGLFRAELRTQQDYEYWLRFSRYHDMAYVDATLVSYRRHPDQLTAPVNIIRIYKNVATILEPYYQEHQKLLPEAFRKEFRRRCSDVYKFLGFAYLARKENRHARQALKKSNQIDPANLESAVCWLFSQLPAGITHRLLTLIQKINKFIRGNVEYDSN